jgi:hypothetical protein
MDRLAELSAELQSVLDQLEQEAMRAEARELQAALAWLDEANRWLQRELCRRTGGTPVDPVPFTYIPVDLRK